MLPTIENYNVIKTRKWSDTEIMAVIQCLNKSYKGKDRSELTDEERVGLIDWLEFDLHASDLIDDYENDKTRKKVRSWIDYHRGKKEIMFDFDTWKWKPRPHYHRRK